MPAIAHYRLDDQGEIETAPPATGGACLPYLVERDGKSVLCVIEGGAFHRFEISDAGVARLVAEGGQRLWDMQRRK